MPAASQKPDPKVELVRRLYELWSRGDAEAAIASVDPRIEWIEPSDSPDLAIYRGPEGVLESMSKWAESWESYAFEVEDARALGDRVLVRLRQHGRGRGSGAEVESTLWQLWTIEQGKAVRAEMFRSEEAALRSLSVEPGSRPPQPA